MAAAATDVIDKTIGSFGKYQAQIIFLIMLGMLPTAFQLYNIVFIIPKVDYVCMDENAENATNLCPCENPQYDASQILSSVTSEWNLICDRTVLASVAQSIIQLGCIPGSLICGYLSDRYGRRRITCAALLLSSFFVSLSAVAPDIWTFLAIRFLTGFPVAGVLSCCYVCMIELSGTSFRNMAFIAVLLTNIFAYFAISLISYLVREWRYIQLYSSAPWFLTIFYIWILPESPRWLIAVGQTEEAIELLTKIARRNGLPTDHIASIVNETNKEREKSENDREQCASFTDLFKTSKLRLYSICIALMWMINGHLMSGIGQYVGRLQGNLYLNTMLSALFVSPVIVLFILFTKYFKRRVGIILSLSLTSLSLLFFILTPNSIPYFNLPFIILASLGANISIIQTHLFSSEIFPTIVRNSAFGFAAMASRVGSTLAPFVVNIGIEWVTITIFIIFILLSITICCILPETKGIVLLNTIKETEMFFGRKASDEIKTVK